MGTLFCIDQTDYLRDKACRVKGKLARLGIMPRSNKYWTLFHRWMAQ